MGHSLVTPTPSSFALTEWCPLLRSVCWHAVRALSRPIQHFVLFSGGTTRYAGISCHDDHLQLSFRGKGVDEKLFDVGLIKILINLLSLEIRDVGLIQILVNLL